MSDDSVRDSLSASIATIVRLSSTPVARGYGVDLVCFDDLTDRMVETDPDSVEALQQDCYHRVTTGRGTIADDPDFGIDVTSFLHRGMTPADLAAIGGQCETEINKDDRVASVTATATFSAITQTLLLTIDVTPENSELTDFTLIIAVTNGAALLKEILSS